MAWVRQLIHRILGEHKYVSAALIDQAIVSGTSFLTAILLARFLGAEEFGRYVLAWFVVYLAQNVQNVLISAPLMTLSVSWDDRQKPTSFGAVFAHQALLSIATFVLAYTTLKATGLIEPDWRLDDLALPAALLAAAVHGPDSFRTYNFVRDRGWRSVTIDGMRCSLQFAGLLAMFFFWSTDASVANALWLMALANLLPLALCLFWLDRIKFDRAVFTVLSKRHWRFSRWLLAATFARWGRESLASFAVGSVLGLAEVGILRAAQQLVFAVNVPLQALGNVIPVHASRAFAADGFEGLKSFIKTFTIKFMVPMAGLLAIIGVFGETLVVAIYGQSYAGYGYVVTLYAMVMTLYLGKDAMLMCVRAMHRTDIEFQANMIAAVVGVLAIYPLVLAFGMVGALLAEGLFIVAVIALGIHLIRNASDAAKTVNPGGHDAQEIKT